MIVRYSLPPSARSKVFGISTEETGAEKGDFGRFLEPLQRTKRDAGWDSDTVQMLRSDAGGGRVGEDCGGKGLKPRKIRGG